MPVSVGAILMLCSALLLPGSMSDTRDGVEAGRVVSIDLAPTTTAIIEATPAGLEWPWRISEANTVEDDSGEGDDLGPWHDPSSRRRLPGDRGPRSPIRQDRGTYRPTLRSPILRC